MKKTRPRKRKFTVKEKRAEPMSRVTPTSDDSKEEKKLINQSKTIYWWDIQNCPIPRALHPIDFIYVLKKRLTEEGFLGQVEINIVVPFKDSFVPRELEDNKEEVTVHRVREYNRPTPEEAENSPDKKKELNNNEIADVFITSKVRKWILTACSHHNILMSTSDGGFSKLLKELADAHHTTLLAYNPKSVKAGLIQKAHYTWIWREFLYLGPKSEFEEKERSPAGKRQKREEIAEEFEEKEANEDFEEKERSPAGKRQKREEIAEEFEEKEANEEQFNSGKQFGSNNKGKGKGKGKA